MPLPSGTAVAEPDTMRNCGRGADGRDSNQECSAKSRDCADPEKEGPRILREAQSARVGIFIGRSCRTSSVAAGKPVAVTGPEQSHETSSSAPIMAFW